MLAIILLIVVLFSSTYFLTRLIVLLAKKKQWLDLPNSRSSHVLPTPKSGGLAFVIIYFSATLYCYLNSIIHLNQFLALSLGLVVAVLGMLDDLLNLQIKVRLSIHLVCAFSAITLLGGVPDIHLFGGAIAVGVVGIFVSVVMFAWFINLVNFMDGIDGLATMEAIFVCLAASFFCWQQGDNNTLIIFMCFVACLGGFLLVNYPPAKIFMGDVGSNYLGMILGVLALISIHNAVMTFWTWVILLGVFIVDSSSTLIQRYLNGEVWYHAHRTHFYQLAALKLKSHSKVNWLVTAVNLFWLFPLAWVTVIYQDSGVLTALIAYIPLLFIGLTGKAKLTLHGC